MSSSLLQSEDLYEIRLASKKAIHPFSYVNDILRKNKTDYHLWIDEEKREVRVNGQLINASPHIYKLLVHFAKNVGKFSHYVDLFKAIWNVSVQANEPAYSNYKERVQQSVSRYIYKFGGGTIKTFIRGDKRGYYIDDTLNSCLISMAPRHLN